MTRSSSFSIEQSWSTASYRNTQKTHLVSCLITFENYGNEYPKAKCKATLRLGSIQTCEPLATRTHYPQSQSYQISQRQCDRPKEPEHGSVQCRLLNDKYTCTGKCETGYKFPDGRETYILDCSKHTGQWTPYRNFPDCIGSYGGGGYSESASHLGSRSTGYSQTSSSGSGSYSRSYSHSSSGQGSNYSGGGSNFERYTSLARGTGQRCSQLKSPSYGSKHCSMTNGQW
ncbi:putative hemocytin [Trichonephila clavipes]|nr:putative hemocytin [Trichonephila clavipes]